MTMKTLTGALVTELRDTISKQGLNSRSDISASVLSTESMEESALAAAVSARKTLESVINESIDMVLSTEGETITVSTAQRDAAVKIAALAVNPVAGMQAMAQGSMPKVGSNGVSVSVEEMGLGDSLDASTLSTEAYDDQSMNNALYFSIAYNLFAAKQDAFGETFFPTITIDPTMSGITISTEVTSLYQDFQRTQDGATNRSKFAKVTLAKAIYDNNLLGAERNKLVPVSTTASAANLLPALDHVDTSTGETITTAPLVVGKEINLLGISQTAAMLAKGVMDSTDSLDRTINLSSVIVSLTQAGAAGAPNVVEYFRVPVGMLPYSNFTYTTQDHEKDLGLSFETRDVAFLTSSTVMYNGAASTILAALAPGHVVKLHLKLSGDGNTQYGDVGVYVSAAGVDSVLDAAGNALAATSATYTTIAAAFAGMVVEAYELEAYLTNSNLRKQGQLVTIDRYEQVYSVPVRSGISVVMPINSTGANDSGLMGQVVTTGYRMNIEAVKTLTTFTDNLASLTANGANANLSLMGVGRYHVDAYYTESVLDMPTLVDSESSTQRASDIREVLLGRIRDEVYNCFVTSKFNIAHSMIHGDQAKVGVIIGTSSRIRNYLCDGDDTIDLGAGFVVKVVETPNVLVGDVMYITFSNHMSSKSKTEVDPISFGQCVWAPTITTDVATTISGGTSRRFQTMPRFAHIVNLPIMMRMRVTNMVSVLGKVSRYQHTV